VPGAPASSAELELYDLTADPHETRNLAGEQPDVVEQLRRRLAEQGEARPQISR
jgi:iduronate 2-sulfatase